ncbi:MAG: amidase [Actinobacteria bacterium 13_1_20CM_3_71_11]|nr:MAG: amidase [Actinobacteria bacterium 13_1_20CM_3_71_11]
MHLDEYAGYDAVGLRALIATGEVSAAEVEDTARRALDAANEVVNGLAVPLFAPALDHAEDGPFAGVPFLIKDSGPMASGVPFFCGSRAVPGVLAGQDHELMARFRAAGLVTLGLTTAPELGLSFATEPVRSGPTRNPWDPQRGVGGSSGGAAALVAAGAVPVAHGNDGAGSIRIPASCCGLVGLKPTRGRTPSGPDPFGMVHEFALTRTVRDAAHLLDAVAGPGVGDRYPAPPPAGSYAAELGRDPGRLRVAVTASAGTAVDPEVASAALRVGTVLEELGHTVEAAGPDVDRESAVHAQKGELVGIAAPFLMAPRRPDPARMEAVSRRVLVHAAELTALDLVGTFAAQDRVSRAVAGFFAGYDLLVTPTLARLPAPHGTLRQDDPGHTVDSWLRSLLEYGPFTSAFNVSGHPAVSLPLAQSVGGLPIGVQLVAGYGREDLLFRVAVQLEEALPWRDRRPVRR